MLEDVYIFMKFVFLKNTYGLRALTKAEMSHVQNCVLTNWIVKKLL